MRDENRTKEQLIREVKALRQQVARLTALEGEHKRVETELETYARQQAALFQLSADLAASLDENEICHKVVQGLHGRLGYDYLGLFLVDGATGDRVLRANIGWPDAPPGHRLSSGRGLSERPLSNGQLHYTPDVTDDLRYSPGIGGKTELDVPLKVGEKILGVLVVESMEPDAFDEDDFAVLTAAASQTAVALERAREHQAVKEAELRYQSLFDRVPIGLYRSTPSGQFLDVNRALVKMLGYPDHESLLVTRTIDLYADDGDRERWQALLQRENVVQDFEARLRQHDGTVIWARDTARAVRDAEGQNLYYEGSMENITERKQAEEVLQRRAEELDALQATVLDITVPHNLPTLLEAIVVRAVRLLNAPTGGLYLCEPDRRQVRCVVSYNTPSDYRGTVLAYGEGAAGIVARTGNPLNISDYRTWSERATVFEEEQPFGAVLAVPLLWQGQVTGVIDVVQNAGDRAFTQADLELLTLFANHAAIAVENTRLYEQAQEEIAERKRLERQSEERRLYLEQVLACAPDAIVALDAQHRITEWNPGAEKLFGYTPEEVIGRDIDDLIAGPDAEMLREAVGLTRQALDGKSVPPSEIARYRKDGTLVNVIVAGSPILVEDKVVGTVAVYTDISDRVQAEENMARHAREMAALYDTSLEINSQPDLSTLLKAIVRRASELLRAPMGALYLVQPNGEELELVVSHNLPGDYVGTTLRLGEGLSGRIAQTGELMMVPDYRDWAGRADVYADVPFRRVLGVPLKSGDKIIGVINITDDERRGLFDEDAVRLVSLFADQAAIAVENARLYQEARQRLAELALLFDISATASSSLDVDTVLQATARQITVSLKVEECAIYAWERDRDVIVNLIDYSPHPDWWKPEAPGTEYRLSDYPVSRQVLTERQPIVVQANDPDADPAELRWMMGEKVQSVLMVPMVVRDEAVGVLEVMQSAESGERMFTPTEISLCQTLANQAAAALENARLFEGERKQRQLAETLQEVASVLNTSLEREQVLESILDQLARVIEYDNAVVMLLSSDALELEIVAHRGLRPEDRDLGLIQVEKFAHLQEVLQSHRPGIIPDTLADPRWQRWQASRHIRCWLGAPLVVQDRVIGLLNLGKEEVGFYGQRDAELAMAFATQAAIAIENARLFEETSRRAEQMAMLNRTGLAITAALELEEVLDTLYEQIKAVIDVGAFYVALYDEATGRIEFPLLTGITGPGTPDPLDIHRRPGITGYIIRSGQPLYVPDTWAIPEEAAFHPIYLIDQPARSYIGIPLILREQVIGVLSVQSYKPNAYTKADLELLTTIATQATIAIDNARLFRNVERGKREWETTFDAMRDAVVLVDQDRRILRTNRAFAHLVQKTFTQIVGQMYYDVMGDIICRESTCPLEQTTEGGLPAMCTHEYRGRIFEVQATPLPRDGAEEPDHSGGAIRVMRDISERVQAEKEIHQLEQQFHQAQKMEALGQMAGGIAHDFNNLLTIIHLGTRFLEQKMHPEDPLWEHVQRIRNSGERAASLTKQLLSFSRREVVEPQVLDLNQVVEDLSRMLMRIIGEDIELVTALTDDLWLVEIDPAQMDQVIVNLVMNARDAMPEGGTLSIETGNVTLDEAYAAANVEAQPGEHVMLAISDTGVGMDKEVRAHLFEPFFTTKERGQGTGLGLPTVFGIIKQNEGHIQVHSEAGQGTTVKIYLPAAGEAELARDVPPRALPPAADRLIQGTETILVVEDEAEVRNLAMEVLKSCGYRVMAASSGPEALQISEQYDGPIHLLLTDVVMPHMNGRELAERLQRQRPAVQVLYMSGYANDAIGHHGVLTSGTTFLPKPLTIENLTQKVRSVLDGRL